MSVNLKPKKPSPLKANTSNQKRYLKKLRHNPHDILVVVGPAGTGKSYMAMRTAIEEYQKGTYDRIIITRPTVSSGEEDYGYLPGTLIEKLSPWCIPLIDIAKEYFTPAEVTQMLVREEIEIAPLGFMRGRTLKNAFVIVDEAQNCSADQLRMVMTRLGEGSRMVITGDTEQVDLRKGESGLLDFVQRLKADETFDDHQQQGLPSFITEGVRDNRINGGSDYDDNPRVMNERPSRIGCVELSRADVVRHPVIDEVLRLYGM